MMIEPRGIRKHFPEAFGRAMTNSCSFRGLKVSDEVLRRSKEIITTIINDNPIRVASEFQEADAGKASSSDVAVAIATSYADLIITNALYEGRKDISMGDVYLAIADFRYRQIWPWRGMTPVLSRPGGDPESGVSSFGSGRRLPGQRGPP